MFFSLQEGVLEAQGYVSEVGWDAIVHLGFENVAKGLKLETVAWTLGSRAAQKKLSGPRGIQGPRPTPVTSQGCLVLRRFFELGGFLAGHRIPYNYAEGLRPH